MKPLTRVSTTVNVSPSLSLLDTGLDTILEDCDNDDGARGRDLILSDRVCKGACGRTPLVGGKPHTPSKRVVNDWRRKS